MQIASVLHYTPVNVYSNSCASPVYYSNEVMMRIFLALTISVALGRPLQVQAQQCGVNNLPSYRDPGNNIPRIQYRHQVLIPSYNFTCCGVVTQWGAYVEPGDSNDSPMIYNATFQVWRPDGNGNGVYTMVGENVYLNAIQSFIEFQPGDVVGYYLDSTRESNNMGVQLDVSNSNLEVYYGPPQERGTFDIRAEGVEVEDRGAPILFVGVGESNNPLAAVLISSLAAALLLAIIAALVVVHIIVRERKKKRQEEHGESVATLNEISSSLPGDTPTTDDGDTPTADGGDTPTTDDGNIQAANSLFSDQDAHTNGTIPLCSNNAYDVNNSNPPNDQISLHSNDAYDVNNSNPLNDQISLHSNNAYDVNNSNPPNDQISLHSNNAYELKEEAEYEVVM
ncbi:uncharacterized protein LOC135351739 isoform X2 [Halichondria panicea]|uniref:uncharacterized protein LOC135351739 isoform X2 n=1 Tax=Halichondria panicea TaxID=6063 RepID=UPI00312B2E2B